MKNFLKNLIFEASEEEEEVKKQVVDTTFPITPISSGVPAEGVTPLVDITAFDNHFKELYEKADDPRPSFHEFVATIKAMGPMIPEQTAYNAAFAALKANGLSKETLLETGKKTLELIEKDRQEYKLLVENKLKGAQDKLQLAAKKRQEAAQLIAEAEQIQVEAGKIQAEVGAKSALYDQKRISLIQDIEGTLQKINNYLT